MGNVTWELLGIRAGILYIPARLQELQELQKYRLDETLGIFQFFFFLILDFEFTFSTLNSLFFSTLHESMSPLEFILQRVTSPHACSFFLFLLKFNTLKKFVLTRTLSSRVQDVSIFFLCFFFFFFRNNFRNFFSRLSTTSIVL